jgi:hypothetical protein
LVDIDDVAGVATIQGENIEHEFFAPTSGAGRRIGLDIGKELGQVVSLS